MILTEQESKDFIEDACESRIARCHYINPITLSVEFAKMTDVGRAVIRRSPIAAAQGKPHKSQPLCQLSAKLPVVVFHNAHISICSSLGLTKEPHGRFSLMQDPFHRDDIGELQAGQATLLYKKSGAIRRTPTYYAMHTSVQTAIAGLPLGNVPEDIIQNLLFMTMAIYDFGYTKPAHVRSRVKVAAQYDGFTHDVFEAVPEDLRYSHCWAETKPSVVMHSNLPNTVLHGRPSSTNDSGNILNGLHLSL